MRSIKVLTTAACQTWWQQSK